MFVGIFCRECVYDIVNYFGHLLYFLHNLWGSRCWTGPFKYRWSRGYIYNSYYYHDQIGSMNLSHAVIYSVVGGYTTICCRFHIQHIPRDSWALFVLLLCSLMMCANNGGHYGLMVALALFAHYPTSFSSLCRCTWTYWTSKMLVGYILSSVCLRSSQLSVIFHAINRVVCIQLTYLS